MIRAVAIAAVLAASVTVAQASEVTISSVDQCNEAAMQLDEKLQDTSVSGDALDQATQAVDSLKSACEAGDLETASNAATVASDILITE